MDAQATQCCRTRPQVSFALSEFAKSGENLAEVLNTHPLLLKLGYGEAPSMRRSNYDSVAMLEYDGSYLKAALEAGGEWFKAGDWRCAWRSAAGPCKGLGVVMCGLGRCTVWWATCTGHHTLGHCAYAWASRASFAKSRLAQPPSVC